MNGCDLGNPDLFREAFDEWLRSRQPRPVASFSRLFRTRDVGLTFLIDVGNK